MALVVIVLALASFESLLRAIVYIVTFPVWAPLGFVAGATATAFRALGAFVRGSQDLRLTAQVDRAALAARLENVRLQYGACRAGEPLEGDGATRTVVKLDCDRGPLDLSLGLEGDRISRLRFSRSADAVCPP